MSAPPTERELQIERLNGITPVDQRYWVSRGFWFDMFGNCTYRRAA